MTTFTYLTSEDDGVELEYSDDDLLDFATAHFVDYAKRDFSDSIAWLAGRFYDEAVNNAVHAIVSDGQNAYINDLLVAKSSDPLFVKMAEDKAINEYNDRGE